jgi:hypothetical protein
MAEYVGAKQTFVSPTVSLLSPRPSRVCSFSTPQLKDIIPFCTMTSSGPTSKLLASLTDKEAQKVQKTRASLGLEEAPPPVTGTQSPVLQL